MSLFPSSIGILQKTATIESQKQQQPPEYRAREKKRDLTDDLKQDALKLLKERLAKQKREIDEAHSLSVLRPFSHQIALTQASANLKAIPKIDPSTQISQLFEKLVRALIRVDKSGISKTSLVLGDEFATSVFSGTKITITEYSSAPKIFNIQFNMSPEALAFYEKHAASLMTALKSGKFGFEMGRIDAHLLETRKKPLIKAIERQEDQE